MKTLNWTKDERFIKSKELNSRHVPSKKYGSPETLTEQPIKKDAIEKSVNRSTVNFSDDSRFYKGADAVGTVHNWADGTKRQKQNDGTWKIVSEGKKSPKQEDDKDGEKKEPGQMEAATIKKIKITKKTNKTIAFEFEGRDYLLNEHDVLCSVSKQPNGKKRFTYMSFDVKDKLAGSDSHAAEEKFIEKLKEKAYGNDDGSRKGDLKLDKIDKVLISGVNEKADWMDFDIVDDIKADKKFWDGKKLTKEGEKEFISRFKDEDPQGYESFRDEENHYHDLEPD